MAREFQDRRDAGRQLGEAVAALGLADPVVLALPRGGVPVGAEVAKQLGAPLDVLLVRKIGVPQAPEIAAGAIVEGDQNPVLNTAVMAGFGLDSDGLAPIIARERETIRERRQRYLAGRTPIELAGRDAVVVDDGIATGATMKAALQGLSRKHPRSVTLAVPVGPEDTSSQFGGLADNVVCLIAPRHFHAVGAHYVVFDQTQDSAVAELLAATPRKEP
jgi:predicted phosphoribosyltransferase